MASLREEIEAALAAHARPGFRQKLLSANVIDEKGLRGWVPIIRRGELVKVRDMILAEMPEEHAEIRQTFFQQLDERQRNLFAAPPLCSSWWCRLKRYFKGKV